MIRKRTDVGMVTVFLWAWVTRLTDFRCQLLTAADKILRDSRYFVGAQTRTWSGDVRTPTTRCIKRWRTRWSWVIQADQVWFCSRIAAPSALLFWKANMNKSWGWKRIVPSASWRATCLCGWRKRIWFWRLRVTVNENCHSRKLCCVTNINDFSRWV